MTKTTKATEKSAGALVPANISGNVSNYPEESAKGRPLQPKALDKLKAHSAYMAEHAGESFSGKVAGVKCYTMAHVDEGESADATDGPLVRFSVTVARSIDKLGKARGILVTSGPRPSLDNACRAIAHAFGSAFHDSAPRAFRDALEAHGYDYSANNEGTREARSESSGAKVAGRPTKSATTVSVKALAHYATSIILAARRSALVASGESGATACERESLATVVADALAHYTSRRNREAVAAFESELNAVNADRYETERAMYERKVAKANAARAEEREATDIARAVKSTRVPKTERAKRAAAVVTLRALGMDATAISATLAVQGASDEECAQALADASA